LKNYTLDPGKIVVIAAGFDAPVEPDSAGLPAVAAPLMGAPAVAAPVPFILMVTNTLPHKNTERACAAFAASRAVKLGVALRVVGSISAAARALLSRGGVNVEIHASVDDHTLTAWYRDSAFLFSPTLAEGYNLPIAEAIASGANVLCSDIPVHREFFESYAEFFDPTRTESMVAALDAALQRGGRWHRFDPAAPHRRYRDMAADYRRLFERISQRAA
jgi:glycosyltransferase involved in cell wall biosynthesis